MDQRYSITESTLGELREVIAAARGMPEDSRVRVRTRLGSSGDGRLLTRVFLVAPSEVVEDRGPFHESPAGQLFEPRNPE